ncbi:LacI family DNA-binding transcriptional regulator [Maribacter sp. HTCC2170]|uniref:LacI family DNA-binding transcriptional regulator n=1 Tax=Maribacter sp. (strain HTCC2170 / KCCM 42371) TaxID=313603 RepID=UPI00006BD2B6|nr:LacI family DNA-binding transcriptional regulator [Maribacter sp. HTCC2170]EAR02858.1 putative LacI-family transcriptional regulator [Maribacter sp. HTCC2170]
MQKNNVTIHDLAKALNINPSTVSRALNNSSRVTQQTKTKILAKADELGYQRNALASNLRKNKTNTIGVIVPRISRHFFSSAIAGIEETAFEFGYNVMICQSLEELERERNLISSLMANRVAGVLLSVSMETTNYDHMLGLKKNGTPILFFDRHCEIPGNSNVLIDDFQSGFDATEHLIANGCKIIAHFSGPKELKIYQNRLRGYLAALQKHCIPYRPELVFTSRLMEEDGIENAKKIMSLGINIDGIFAANDVSAIGAMKHLKSEGVKIPEDIGIVGFSNEPISAVIEPSLTTIDQSGHKIGKLATKLLLKQIKNESGQIQPETLVLKTALISRDSSKHISTKN